MTRKTSNSGKPGSSLLDEYVPEHRAHALVKVMPQCRLSVTELREAIMRETQLHYAVSAIKNWDPPQNDAQRHMKRIVATVRKLSALLDDRLAAPLFKRDYFQDANGIWLVAYKRPLSRARAQALKRRLDLDLSELVRLAAARGADPVLPDAMGQFLQGLVDIYEQATGQPAKLPWTDRITGEVRGALMDFLQIAGKHVFEKSPMTPDAIRQRLRAFVGTGVQTKKNSTGHPVQSESDLTSVSVTKRKQREVTSDAKRPDRPSGAPDRRGR